MKRTIKIDVFKNLAKYKPENNFVGLSIYCYVERSSIMSNATNFDILIISLSPT